MTGACLTLVRTIVAVLAMATAWKTALLARSTLQIRLFKTNVTIAYNTTLDMLTEADYSGYSPIDVASLNGPAVDASGNAYLTTPEVYFSQDGGATGNNVYSAGLVGTVAGGVTATATVTTTAGVISAPVITAAGSGYVVAPKVTVAGGGTGAIVTATILGGVVVSLTVVDGGSGYTGATLVIDDPVELIGGANFDAPLPMQVVTDAIPVVAQQYVPAGA